MKKIGILTFHRATNYGAVLQAYSLSNRLSQDLSDCEIEIIDYSTAKAQNDHFKDVIRPIVKSKVSDSYRIFQKNRMFNDFSNHLLKLSPDRIVDDGVKKVSDYISQKYDCVISGSDAVFSWNGKTFPSAYLLGEEIDCLKTSYAASAHRLFYKTEEKIKIDYCSKAFSTYSYIGVRDEETANFVKYCNPKVEVHHNCDPTFLLDINRIHELGNFRNLKNILGIDERRPIVIVMSPDEQVGKMVIERFGKTHKVISLFVRNKYIQDFYYDLSPFEWASVFGLAEITVTEYFHATILSLLNGTPTLAIDKLDYKEGYEGKIHDLMINRLSLDDLYVNIGDIRREGYEFIKQKVDSIIANAYYNRISEAIAKETKCYDNFKLFLENNI